MQINSRAMALILAPTLIGAGFGPTIDPAKFGLPTRQDSSGYKFVGDAMEPGDCPTTLVNQKQIILVEIKKLKFNKVDDRNVRVIKQEFSAFSDENNRNNLVKRLDYTRKHGSKEPTQYDIELSEAAAPTSPASGQDYILVKVVLGEKMAFLDRPYAIQIPKPETGKPAISLVCGVETASSYGTGPAFNFIKFKVPAQLAAVGSQSFSPFNIGIVVKSDKAGDITLLPVIIDPKIRHDSE